MSSLYDGVMGDIERPKQHDNIFSHFTRQEVVIETDKQTLDKSFLKTPSTNPIRLHYWHLEEILGWQRNLLKVGSGPMNSIKYTQVM